MRRWDRLVDAYMEEHRARGVCAQTAAYAIARLTRWGIDFQRANRRREDAQSQRRWQLVGPCATQAASRAGASL